MSSPQVATAFPFANPDVAAPWMDLKLPSLTLASLIEAQHKNAAALSSANQVAFDGLKTLLQRQGSLLTASVETCSRATSDFLAAQSFEERAAKQADATRDTYFSVVGRMRELSDIVIESNMAAVGIVNARIIEAFSDLRAMFAPPAFAPPAPIEAPAPALPAPAAIGAPVAARDDASAAKEAAPASAPEPALPVVAAAPPVAREAAVPTEAEPVMPPAVAAEASKPKSEAGEPKSEAVAAPAPALKPEVVAAPAPAPKPETIAAPAPAPKPAAPVAKLTAPPARTTVPKAPPPRPPRRPTSRG